MKNGIRSFIHVFIQFASLAFLFFTGQKLHSNILIIPELLGIFLVLIIVNVYRLGMQVLKRQPGSRLTLRLLLMFVLLAIVPVGIVYSFSIWLIQEGVDSWFDADVEQALQDSVDLSRSSLDLHMRKLRQQTEPMARELARTTPLDAPFVINDLMRR